MASLTGLAKYTSDGEDESNTQLREHRGTTTDNGIGLETKANLESEWENFEKMLASNTDDEVAATSTTETRPTIPQTQTDASTDVENPYAYLIASMPSGSAVTSDQEGTDPSAGLEEFLERAAQAALDAHQNALPDLADGSPHHSGSRSPGSEHSGSHSESGSDSGSDSGHKSRSRTRSQSKAKTRSPSLDKPASGEKKSLADALKKIATSKVSPERRFPSRDRRKSRSSRSRSRSRRSRSRSHGHRRRRSSRSRSRSRGHRRKHRRSRSRDRSHRHRSSRSHRSHRRRSGSRHRSRRHGSSRSKRSRRDGGESQAFRKPSRLGSNKRALLNTDPAAQALKAAAAAASKPEDFKSRMKRELQEAAQKAMAGKNIGTPQEALIQSMAAMHARAQELTGVEVPKFYNPAAINPLKFAEQQQKRKLLWSKAAQNKDQTLQQFQGTEVVTDEKYRKLMGIKGDAVTGPLDEEQRLKQQKLFHQLDQEYNMARLNTHTHRGMGLGIVSSAYLQATQAHAAPNNVPTEPQTHPQS